MLPFLLALLLASPASAGATEIQPGVQYEAGKRIGVGALGVSLVVPPEWLAGLPAGAEVLMMGSNSKPGLVIVTAERGVTTEQIAAELAKPQPIEGIVLTPDAAPTVRGATVQAHYTATGQPLVGHARAVIGDNGTALLVVAIGPAEHDGTYGDLVASIAGSAVFDAIVAPVAPVSDGGAWDQRIRGKQLRYMKSATGFYDDRKLWLCSDGTFAWKDSSGAFSSDVSGDFSASVRDAQTGTWTVQGSTLNLAFEDGNTAQWTLSSHGSETHVNGTRWFLGENTRCP